MQPCFFVCKTPAKAKKSSVEQKTRKNTIVEIFVLSLQLSLVLELIVKENILHIFKNS